jgi:protein-L-isoaspartate(D-aspartate) O-methyltransferase
MTDYSEKRRDMVETQLRGRGIHDRAVLEAFGNVPREDFIPPDMANMAYADVPLPIGKGQTISQPFVVALMVQSLELQPTDRVLDVGTGSGYATAIVAFVASEVYTIERHRNLADSAAKRLAGLDSGSVHVRCGDGSLGWPEHAPYDAIVVSAGGPSVPEALRQQLGVGGRLVMPVGDMMTMQRLIRVRRVEKDNYSQEELGLVRFVPLIGDQGWEHG